MNTTTNNKPKVAIYYGDSDMRSYYRTGCEVLSTMLGSSVLYNRLMIAKELSDIVWRLYLAQNNRGGKRIKSLLTITSDKVKIGQEVDAIISDEISKDSPWMIIDNGNVMLSTEI